MRVGGPRATQWVVSALQDAAGETCVPSTWFCVPGKVDMESTQVAHIVTMGSTLKRILRKLYLRAINKLYALLYP